MRHSTSTSHEDDNWSVEDLEQQLEHNQYLMQKYGIRHAILEVKDSVIVARGSFDWVELLEEDDGSD